MRTRTVCIIAAFGGLSFIEQVSAGGFYSPYQSATAIGTAFAGASVRTDDASFFLYNPAIISSFSKAQTFSDVRGFAPSARIVPSQALSPAGTDITSSGDSGNMTDVAAAAGSVTVIPLGHGLTAGFGSAAPFATSVETDSNWGGRFHLKHAYMVGLNATGAVSWQPASWISIAGGLQGQRFETRFENSALVPTGPASAIEVKAFMKGTDWGVGGVAGVVLRPAAGTSLGLAWRSAMTHDIRGQVGAKLAGILVEGANYDIDLPQTVTAGLEQRLTPDLRLFAELQWVAWSRFKGFDISFPSGRPNEVRPVDWKDTWLAAIGIGYRISDATEVTAGISYDTAASTNGSGTTLSPDANKLLAAIGLITQVPHIGRVSMSYGHAFVEDAPVHASNASSGTVHGTLKSSLDMVAIGFTHEW